MNRVALPGLAVALALSGATSSFALAATTNETSCSPRSGVDDRDVVISWGDAASRPIRWGRATLRVDVLVTSKSTDAILCDPDAWIEIHQISPIRRPIDAGPVEIVGDARGRKVHRFVWSIRDRLGELDAGTYQIDFFSGRAPAIEVEADDRFDAGFEPITSTRTVVKWPTPHKGRIHAFARS